MDASLTGQHTTDGGVIGWALSPSVIVAAMLALRTVDWGVEGVLGMVAADTAEASESGRL